MRSSSLLFLSALILWPLTPAHAGGLSGARSSPLAVDLSVSLQGTYPRHALALVTVSVQSRSSRTLTLPYGCGEENPAAQVLTASGRVVYPPVLTQPSVIPPPCYPPVPFALNPGQTLRHTVYIILRASWVQATAKLYAKPNSQRTVKGKPIHVTLTSGQRPTYHLSTKGGLHADLTPPPGAASAPLVYQDRTRCANGKGGISFTWQVERGTRIFPASSSQCDRLSEWRAVAGWVGYPVANIDYVRSP